MLMPSKWASRERKTFLFEDGNTILFYEKKKIGVLVLIGNIYTRVISVWEPKLYSPSLGTGIWGCGERNTVCIFKVI